MAAPSNIPAMMRATTPTVIHTSDFLFPVVASEVREGSTATAAGATATEIAGRSEHSG